ncbi:MAG TPA: serine hydrolase, partial [Bacillota bacterium]|nr:serine hydrolase [Bacillota bacterium]
YAAGGILSTAPDVAHFTHVLFSGQFLANESLAEMQTFVDAPEGDAPWQTGYGLGIRRFVVSGEEVIGHTGSIPGHSGIAMHNAAKGYTIVILSNRSVIEQKQLFEEVQKQVLDWEP